MAQKSRPLSAMLFNCSPLTRPDRSPLASCTATTADSALTLTVSLISPICIVRFPSVRTSLAVTTMPVMVRPLNPPASTFSV